ncbi:MAG: hypothetical protein VR73_05980 [Gammaproteobacteria bacterium BRH_c0]|nr:MAG: hypothetical protein VR73_05980 [Gammaproteobacteria bacterium BRH_c0]
MTLDLMNNVALLLAVCWIQSFISYRWNKDSLRAQVASGVLFAVATVTVMMVSILVQPGLWLWVDSSMVVISVSTLLYGPIAGGIAMVVGIAYRLWMGGMGATVGMVSLVVAFLAGFLYQILLQRKLATTGTLQMLLFGLVVNGIGALLLNEYFMPVSVTDSPAYITGLLLIMSAATGLLGRQLQYIERKKALERQIKANEERLKSITESIPDQLVVSDSKGKLLDVITPAALASRAPELIGKDMAQLDPEVFRSHFSLVIAGALHSDDSYSDIYATHQHYLLDNKVSSEEHYFESSAKRMVSELEGDKVLILTRDITERKQAEARIRFLAHFDSMTGLPNRHLAIETVDKAIIRAKFNHSGVVVAMLHLDELYIVNQSIGSEAGDFLVKEVTGRLSTFLGDTFLARYSGADFLIIAEELDTTEAIEMWSNNLLSSIHSPVQFETNKIRVRASLGIANFPQHGIDSNQLIRSTTVATQHARESLSKKIQHYDSAMDTVLTDYVQLRDRLATALENDEFEIYYQPYISLEDGQIQGIEAFLRWNMPDVGLKAPDYFLETAEKSGLIVPIGDWVLRKAADQIKSWKEAGLSFGTLAINISSAQLTQGNLVEKIRTITRELSIEANLLTLEVTESSVNRELNRNITMTAQLKQMGVGISIDDFGTGFSNLQYLHRMAVDNLKIDKEFILGFEDDANKRDIVRAIIQIARAMGMKTIAEGVESSQIEALLREMGCTHAQGYYYSKPLPADAMAAFLLSRNAR